MRYEKIFETFTGSDGGNTGELLYCNRYNSIKTFNTANVITFYYKIELVTELVKTI